MIGQEPKKRPFDNGFVIRSLGERSFDQESISKILLTFLFLPFWNSYGVIEEGAMKVIDGLVLRTG